MNPYIRFRARDLLSLLVMSVLVATSLPARARTEPGFVRLEPIERSATRNDHPAAIATNLIRGALSGIRIEGLMKSADPVFSDTELTKIAPEIATTLGNAKPDQDVTFAVLGRHGTFGENSPVTVTTGRVFVEAGGLNVILGRIHSRYEDLDFGRTVSLTPGQRGKRIAPVGTLVAESAGAVKKRGDWLRFDLAQLAAAPTRPTAQMSGPATDVAPQTPDATELRHSEIQSRLKLLDRLKADGLITEDEYRERRRAILQSI